MCLSALDDAIVGGEQVVDFGCGSGILAIAALRLGAACALGVDNDPQAITATATTQSEIILNLTRSRLCYRGYGYQCLDQSLRSRSSQYSRRASACPRR